MVALFSDDTLHAVTPSAVDELLSPRERQIARLAARGGSARQIAARVAVREGTVRVHLRNIYAKLGVRSRAELARLFA